MTRRAVSFVCGGATLHASLDCASAHGATGLLIVSGGTEIRAGAYAGQADLAQRLSEQAGVPVFRYDRRGIGDSEGSDPGWRLARDDLAAAVRAFRAAQPGLRRVVGYGLCDAASALMLHAATLDEFGLDALVLANPWTIDEADPIGHTGAALRRRYLSNLADPRALWRLISGRVDFGKLWRGLTRAARKSEPPSALAEQVRQGLARFTGPVTLLAAQGDRVGATFLDGWPADDPRLHVLASTTHSFGDDDDARDWLFNHLLEATASRH
jgi:exosortase A-associated hydrolase 1